jgi:sterol desaturase/sphingolipid hydroxylase (fatty acid hydroxylase superfamily)
MYLNLIGTVLVLTALFYGLELLVPAEKGQPVSKLLFNTTYYFFIVAGILGLQFILGPLFSYLLNGVQGGLLPRLISAPDGVWSQLGFALAFAVVWDLWQYWIHRLQHTWPVLWETHKFHHSESALNSSAQARQHLLNYVLFSTLYLPVLIIFGSLTPHFVATFLMFKLWGFVNHANIRIDVGPLTPIVSGPQWHRIHHSIYPEHHDKNFAAFFPFIDLVFGTYYWPRKGEYPPTGLPAAQYSGSIREATVAPFIGLYKIVLSRIRVTPGRT